MLKNVAGVVRVGEGWVNEHSYDRFILGIILAIPASSFTPDRREASPDFRSSASVQAAMVDSTDTTLLSVKFTFARRNIRITNALNKTILTRTNYVRRLVRKRKIG